MFLPTLFNVKVNWSLYFIGLLGLFVLFPSISFFQFIAYAITLHQFMLLFYAFNHFIPIRYLAGSMACLQYLVGPANAYGGLDNLMYFKYQMQVPEEVYFTYALPAVIFFIVGLHVFGKPTGEIISRKKVAEYINDRPMMPLSLIIIGFIASFLRPFVPSWAVNVFYIVDGFKVVGLLILLLGTRKLQIWMLIIVFGYVALIALRTAMFHDFITWSFFLLAVLAIKYKPSFLNKIGIGIGLFVILAVVQQLKSVYRASLGGEQGNVEVFQESLESVQESQGLLSKKDLAQSNTRINQGFIVTYSMKHIPDVEPFSEGKELLQILEAAFLPRFLAPNKLKAGDNELVFKYTGLALNDATSMSISALGDGYINFGVFGGIIFMFFWGMTFSIVLNLFEKVSKRSPIILLFTPLVFYYPIRPDTALQTGLGHMVKSSFVIWMTLLILKEALQNKMIQSIKVPGIQLEPELSSRLEKN